MDTIRCSYWKTLKAECENSLRGISVAMEEITKQLNFFQGMEHIDRIEPISPVIEHGCLFMTVCITFSCPEEHISTRECSICGYPNPKDKNICGLCDRDF